MGLSPLDRSMLDLYLTACQHQWDKLPELARAFRAAGASMAQMRGCVRHLIVFAGYGPCLAAMLALHKSGLLAEDTPAKVSGPPGDAFELVYQGAADRVRANVHAADAGLGEWIRLHLYGDVYSSPGLDMRRKQLLACAFLAEAAMPDQLFGHALAGLRFGNSLGELEEAVRLACSLGRRAAADRGAVLHIALKTLSMAFSKHCKETSEQLACAAMSAVESHVPTPHLPPRVHVGKQQRQVCEREEDEPSHRPIAKLGTASDAALVMPSMEEQRSMSGLFADWEPPLV